MHWEIVLDGIVHPFITRFFIDEDVSSCLMLEFPDNRFLVFLKEKGQEWQMTSTGPIDKRIEQALFEQISLLSSIAKVL